MIGGLFNESDMYNFHFLTGKYDLDGYGRVKQIGNLLQKNQPFFKVSEIDKSYVNVEIDRTKENQRILRETLDRMRKQDGEKVLLDAYYRKKIVEYANVFEKENNNMEKSVELSNDTYSCVNNDNLCFENDIFNEFLSKPEENPFDFAPGLIYQNRVQILLLFKGRTLEEIYKALDNDESLFAKKCAAIMRSRDQNLLRCNLHLVREAVDSSFSRCLLNEHKVANLLVENPSLCPGLLKKSAKGESVFDSAFNPDLVSIAPDNNGNFFILILTLRFGNE